MATSTVTLERCARELRIDAEFLRSLVRNGRLPGIPTGETYLVVPLVIESHLARMAATTFCEAQEAEVLEPKSEADR